MKRAYFSIRFFYGDKMLYSTRIWNIILGKANKTFYSSIKSRIKYTHFSCAYMENSAEQDITSKHVSNLTTSDSITYARKFLISKRNNFFSSNCNSASV